MCKLHRWQTFLSQFNAVYEHVATNNNFQVEYLMREVDYLNNDNSQQGQRKLEDIIIDFNEYHN